MQAFHCSDEIILLGFSKELKPIRMGQKRQVN